MSWCSAALHSFEKETALHGTPVGRLGNTRSHPAIGTECKGKCTPAPSTCEIAGSPQVDGAAAG